MRNLIKVGIPILISLVCLLLLLYPWESGPIIEKGEGPMFLVILTDNNENDFLDLKFISPGTGLYRVPVPLSLEILRISGWQVENEQKTFEIQLPPGRMFPSENVRVSLGMDVLEAGKLYRVHLEFLPSMQTIYGDTLRCG